MPLQPKIKEITYTKMGQLTPALLKMALLPQAELRAKQALFMFQHSDLVGVAVARRGADAHEVYNYFCKSELTRKGLMKWGGSAEVSRDVRKAFQLDPLNDECWILYHVQTLCDGSYELKLEVFGCNSVSVRGTYGQNIDTVPLSHQELAIEK